MPHVSNPAFAFPLPSPHSSLLIAPSCSFSLLFLSHFLLLYFLPLCLPSQLFSFLFPILNFPSYQPSFPHPFPLTSFYSPSYPHTFYLFFHLCSITRSLSSPWSFSSLTILSFTSPFSIPLPPTQPLLPLLSFCFYLFFFNCLSCYLSLLFFYLLPPPLLPPYLAPFLSYLPCI